MAAALASLATVLAFWGWKIGAPASPALPFVAPTDPAATLLASGLWSAPGAGPVTPAARAAEPGILSGDTRLLGVFAERGGRGYALFRLPAGPRLVRAGEDIAPGASLVAVRPDGITIREQAGERLIALRSEAPSKAAPATTPAAATTAPGARAARSAACAAPAGFKGSILRLNAELFQGIIARPETWTALLAADRGGLVVKDDSGFSAMLAMRKGDRLTQANGIALGAPDDVVGAVLRPLVAQQQVRVSGQRDGQPREWLLLNAGTCPS